MIYFASPLRFSLWASAFILAAFNLRYWREVLNVFGSMQDALFLANLALCLLLLHALVLLSIPGHKTRIVILALLCPIAAMAAYCADSYGLPVDQEMIRNIGRTDYREVQGVFSYRIVLYVLLLGMLPVLLVARSKITPTGFRQRLGEYAIATGATAAALTLLFTAFPAQTAALTGGNKQLHYLLVPSTALSGLAQQAQSALTPPSMASTMPAGTSLLERPDGAKPLLLFFVIGETARQLNFQLGGYERPTNPQLSQVKNLFYFPEVEACSTSTAVSVPCMMSPLSRTQFNIETMNPAHLVMHELQDAGIHIQWRSNNSGSKPLQSAFETADATEPGAFPDCSPWACLDEVLLAGLEKDILSRKQDRVIVFHQMGSHGPDYFRRYPSSFEIFKPACRTNILKQCSDKEIRNAYDNTIVYTDHLLKQKIDMIERLSGEFDAMLIYVSDHGESLGENGVYLHGGPYEWAPAEQTRVPLILWISNAYANRFELDMACLARQTSGNFSHANLYHTVVGAMQTSNAAYREEMDILAGCRN